MSTLEQVVSSKESWRQTHSKTLSKVQSQPWYTCLHEPVYMYTTVRDDFFHNCQNPVTLLSPSAGEQIHVLWNIHAVDYYTTRISKGFCKVLDSEHFLLWETMISVAINSAMETQRQPQTLHTQINCHVSIKFYLWTIKFVCHNCHTTRYYFS